MKFECLLTEHCVEEVQEPLGLFFGYLPLFCMTTLHRQCSSKESYNFAQMAGYVKEVTSIQ